MRVRGPSGGAFLALLGLLSQLFLRGSRVTRDRSEARKQRIVERRFWIGLQERLRGSQRGCSGPSGLARAPTRHRHL
jgi:hypothetical protein